MTESRKLLKRSLEAVVDQPEPGVFISKESAQEIINMIDELDHYEVTEADVIKWCKARDYKIISERLLHDLLRRN